MTERRCDKCDNSRRLGSDINCWESPPQPLFIGINSTTNQRVVVPMMRPTWPDYHCRMWTLMQPDHPDHPDRIPIEPVPAATHHGSERPQ